MKEIVGAQYIKDIGGKVMRIELTKNQSTTKLISMLNKNIIHEIKEKIHQNASN